MNLEELKNEIYTRQTQKFNGLPVNVKGWEDFLPCLSKGFSIIVTSGSGVGKTTFVLDKFVLDQINFVLNNPEVDCFYSYFSLEETKLRMDLKILSRFLYETEDMEFGIQDFLNLKGNSPLIGKLDKLDSCKDLIDTFNNKVDIVEDCLTASSIRNKIDQTIKKLGNKIFDKNFYYIVVIDNLKFLKEENGKDKKQCIDMLCLEYLQEFRKNFSVIPIVIQHQNRASETGIYDWKKELIINSVKPSVVSLGESTNTQDPATHIIGIFDPNRNEISNYPINKGYDIDAWRDNIRFLTTLKSRDGHSEKEIAFYFNGKVNLFKELEPPDFFKKNGYKSYGFDIQKGNKTSGWKEKLDLE
jgi:replicative DNA helicase